MNNTLNRQRENMCQCACHCHCMNNEFVNKSDIISEINTQNPNSDFPCSFYNNSPISKINGNYDCSNSPIFYSRSPIREMKLENFPLSIKDKINSNNFYKKSRCNMGKDLFDKYNTFEDIFTFKLNKNPLTRSMSSLSKNKFSGISSENLVLKNLLSKIPKHVNSPFKKKPFMNKRYFFNNNIYGKRNRNINSFLREKKDQGFSSVVMPPNDLENIILKSNANTNF